MGNPGGLFHLRKGVVVAVDSPGAPGTEALLLRSGRISEADWTSVLRDGPGDVVALGGIGAAELQVVAMIATQDGAFAVAAGEVEGPVVDGEQAVGVPVADGVHPHELLRETGRRLGALGALPCPVSPYRERFVPGADPSAAARSAVRQAILARATGRRTARDIAFAIGRSLYPVTVEISRMLAEEILAIAPDPPRLTSSTRLESLRPRHAAELSEEERKQVGL